RGCRDVLCHRRAGRATPRPRPPGGRRGPRPGSSLLHAQRPGADHRPAAGGRGAPDARGAGRTRRPVPRLFRPPHGKLTAGKLLRLWRGGQTVVLWNVDPKDFACRTGEELRAWFGRRPLQGGVVVLLHDDRPHAATALPGLIEATRKRGLRFTTPLPWVG